MRTTYTSHTSACRLSGFFALCWMVAFGAFAGAQTTEPADALQASQAPTTQPASGTVHRSAAQQAAAEIDRIIVDAAAAQGIAPTALIDDATFLRRATMDMLGRIPTTREYRDYWKDESGDRRANLVDRLLEDERFVYRWSAVFGDMFRVRQSATGGDQLGQYIQTSLRQNKPYDEMVRQMLIASGSLGQSPEAGFLTAEEADPFEMAGVVTQSLMGVRMKCAQCHDHPFDEWTRKDFYKVAAFFGHTSMYEREEPYRVVRVTYSGSPRVMWPPQERVNQKRQPMDPQWPFTLAAIDEERLGAAVEAREQQSEMQQLTAIDESLFDTGDGGSLDELAVGLESAREAVAIDPQSFNPARERGKLADYVVSPDNAYFNWNISNRIWSELIGHGVVEPIDDFKVDNPPSNPELLDHLAATLIAQDYDLRAFMRTIMLSETYQRSRLVNVSLEKRLEAESLFCASPLRRAPAETIYDSLIIAGHLDNPKYQEGENIKQRTVTVRVVKPAEPAMQAEPAEDAASGDAASAGASEAQEDAEMSEQAAEDADYLARAMRPAMVEGDLLADLDEGDPLMGTRVVAIGRNELIPAAELQMMRDQQREERRQEQVESGQVEYKQVVEYYNDIPVYQSAHRMAAPVPSEHFLRQFGQPSRQLLGEKRDDLPTMRQALILLNGKLANEAAKVGSLEPVARLLRYGQSLDPAIELIYTEIFTRKPTPQEFADAKAIIEASPDVETGVADLRWALLNSHEFRYLP